MIQDDIFNPRCMYEVGVRVYCSIIQENEKVEREAILRQLVSMMK